MLPKFQKPFVIEVWNKFDVTSKRPNVRHVEDVRIGQVFIYLFPLVNGEREIFGSYPILDCDERNVGQLQLRCQLLHRKDEGNVVMPPTDSTLVDEITEQFAENLDINKFDLGEAIECKFKELQGINERLKQRLADVAGGPIFPEKFDESAFLKLKTLSIEDEDEDKDDLNEFERDINTTAMDSIPEEEFKAILKLEKDIITAYLNAPI